MGWADQEGRSKRAERRRDWPIRVYRLGKEPGDDLTGNTTAEERLAMMWPLALEAWTLAGRVLPDYGREETPIRVVDAGSLQSDTGPS